jgi:hypothetical protein
MAKKVAIFEIVFGLWFILTIIPVAMAEQFELLRHRKESYVRFIDNLMTAAKKGEFKLVKPKKPKARNGRKRGKAREAKGRST